MNVGIIGAGAIGGWVAARLALAGHSVSILARGEALALLRSGLFLTEGGATRRAEVHVADDAQAIGPQDLLIIAVKAPALAGIAGAASAMTGPDTIVVPMLNGVPWWFLDGAPLQSIDPGGSIADALLKDQVIGCVVHAASRRTAPNAVEVVHADKLIIGEIEGGFTERLAGLSAVFDNAGLQPDVTGNVRRAIWYKLWGNMTINPVSALTLATADRILSDQKLRPFILACMAEAATIGAAIGCPIEESGEDRMAVTARLGAFKTSMLQDVEAGRPIELEALVGAPREIGRRVGVPTPNIDTLYSLTRLMADNRGLV